MYIYNINKYGIHKMQRGRQQNTVLFDLNS